jgi:hypothetical protein
VGRWKPGDGVILVTPIFLTFSPNSNMKKLIFALSLTTLCSCDFLSSKSADENFIGQYRYFANIPAENTPNDHTMDGLKNSITKMENTEEHYSFKLFTGNTMDFSRLNDTVLVDSTTASTLVSKPNQHIVLMFSDGKGMEFSKLK